MAVEGTAPAGTLTQAAQAIAVDVELDRIRSGIGWVQQASFLDGEQKDQAVDQSQELLEVGVTIQRPPGQRIAQGLVAGFCQKTLAQCLQGFFHALAELVAGASTLLLAG